MDGLEFDQRLSEHGPGDFGDLLEGDMFRNSHVSLSSGMEDLPSDWLNNIFDDPLLTDKVINDITPSPHIQTEHSYSLMTEPAPPSPLLPTYQLDDFGKDVDTDGLYYSSSPSDSSSCHIKQEPPMEDYETAMNLSTAMSTEPKIQITTTPIFSMSEPKQRLQHRVKAERMDIDNSLQDPTMEQVQLPPTPPSSTPSDSEGGLSPQRSSEPRSPPTLLAKKTSNMTMAQPTHTQMQVQLQNPSHRQNQHDHSGPKIVQHPVITTQINQKIPASGQLVLSEEEKRTLVQEGYPIPTKLPLTKAEEKSLKKVRRKIKNKISAQESRRKKKEYVDCLEKRVENYTQENIDLRKKLESLENSNKSLITQLHRLQALVNKASRPIKATSTQTGTCLMMLVLCFAVFLGSWSPTLTNSSSFTSSSQHSQEYMYPVNEKSDKPYGPQPASATYDPYTTPTMRSSRVLMSVAEDKSYPEPPYPYMSKLDNLEKALEDNNTEKSDDKTNDDVPMATVRKEDPLLQDDGIDVHKAIMLRNAFNANNTKLHPNMAVADVTDYQAIMHPDIAAEIHAKYVSMETVARRNNTSSK